EVQEGADACHACLVCASAIGDEPLSVSQFVRMAMRQIAAAVLERILAQHQLDDAMLTEFQNRWQKESEYPTSRVWLRGDRAGLSQVCGKLAEGTLYADELTGKKSDTVAGPLQQLNHFLARKGFIESETAILRLFTEALTKLDLPPPEAFDYFRKFDVAKRDRDLPTIAKLLIPAHEKLWQADYHSLAMVRCTVTALAVERFRVKEQHWPNSLDEIMPNFLKAVPLGPYSGQPTSFRSTADGVTVFSPGPDGIGQGAYWDLPMTQRSNATKYEFRLWDPKCRRLLGLASED